MRKESSIRSTTVPAILELNHVFEGLGHPRRRYLLYTLGVNTGWTLEDLAVEIATWERSTAEPPPDDVVDAVYVSLYHNHVPKSSSTMT